MAAVTPSSIKRISLGSCTGIIANFANTLDSGDTWASGIPDIVYICATQEDVAGTATSEGCGASWSGSTITFYLGEADGAVRLLVITGSAY